MTTGISGDIQTRDCMQEAWQVNGSRAGTHYRLELGYRCTLREGLQRPTSFVRSQVPIIEMRMIHSAYCNLPVRSPRQ